MQSVDGGFMNAYSESEQKYLEGLGWVVEVSKATKVIEVPETITGTITLKQPLEFKRKPGRPAKG